MLSNGFVCPGTRTGQRRLVRWNWRCSEHSILAHQVGAGSRTGLSSAMNCSILSTASELRVPNELVPPLHDSKILLPKTAKSTRFRNLDWGFSLGPHAAHCRSSQTASISLLLHGHTQCPTASADWPCAAAQLCDSVRRPFTASWRHASEDSGTCCESQRHVLTCYHRNALLEIDSVREQSNRRKLKSVEMERKTWTRPEKPNASFVWDRLRGLGRRGRRSRLGSWYRGSPYLTGEKWHFDRHNFTGLFPAARGTVPWFFSRKNGKE
jgi:hypothetical protein